MSGDPPDSPSPLLLRQLPALRAAAALGAVVDLACGRGRNALPVARDGTPLVGIDRAPAQLAALRERARREALPLALLRADLEHPPEPPLAPRSCGALLVFRYLHRPLCPALVERLRPGGLLLYETFTLHQRDLGHGPRNPAFLLEPGELPRLFPELAVEHHWEGEIGDARRFAVAQLVARRP